MGVREKVHGGWWGRRKRGQGRVWEVKFRREESGEKGEAAGHTGSESPVIALTLSWAEVLLSQREWWILCPRPCHGNKVAARRDFCLWALEKKNTEGRQYRLKDIWAGRFHSHPGKLLNGGGVLEGMLKGQKTRETAVENICYTAGAEWVRSVWPVMGWCLWAERLNSTHTASHCAHLCNIAAAPEFSSKEYINRFFLLIKLS